MTVIVDNASSTDIALWLVEGSLVEANKTIYNGECLHVRCTTHILNLIVSDKLKYMN